MAAVPNMEPLAVAVDVAGLPRSLGGPSSERKRPLILRSALKTPIAQQVRDLSATKSEFLDAVKLAKEGIGALPFTLADLKNRKHPENNPARTFLQQEKLPGCFWIRRAASSRSTKCVMFSPTANAV